MHEKSALPARVSAFQCGRRSRKRGSAAPSPSAHVIRTDVPSGAGVPSSSCTTTSSTPLSGSTKTTTFSWSCSRPMRSVGCCSKGTSAVSIQGTNGPEAGSIFERASANVAYPRSSVEPADTSAARARSTDEALGTRCSETPPIGSPARSTARTTRSLLAACACAEGSSSLAAVPVAGAMRSASRSGVWSGVEAPSSTGLSGDDAGESADGAREVLVHSHSPPSKAAASAATKRMRAIDSPRLAISYRAGSGTESRSKDRAGCAPRFAFHRDLRRDALLRYWNRECLSCLSIVFAECEPIHLEGSSGRSFLAFDGTGLV